MPVDGQSTQAANSKHGVSPEEWQEHKQHVLTQGTPAIVRRIAGTKPQPLVSTAERGFLAVFQLTNPDLRMADGQLIHEEQVGLKWERVIDASKRALHEVLTFRDFGRQRIEFPIAFTFQAAFEDVYAVRARLPEQFGTLRPPSWHDGALTFLYEGLDNLDRRRTIAFSPTVRATDGTTAHMSIVLDPRESRQILVSMTMDESPHVRGHFSRDDRADDG